MRPFCGVDSYGKDLVCRPCRSHRRRARNDRNERRFTRRSADQRVTADVHDIITEATSGLATTGVGLRPPKPGWIALTRTVATEDARREKPWSSLFWMIRTAAPAGRAVRVHLNE